MFKLLFNGILNVVKSLLGLILAPVNALVEGLFPSSLTSAISNFNTLINNYVVGGVSWFGNLLPPIFKGLVVMALTFIIGYYTVVWSYTAIIKIYNVIQKIKFW